jgi:hypothetical protein
MCYDEAIQQRNEKWRLPISSKKIRLYPLAAAIAFKMGEEGPRDRETSSVRFYLKSPSRLDIWNASIEGPEVIP